MPPSTTPIAYPARYAPGVAVNYADDQGMAVTVSSASPLPVAISAAAGGSTPPVLAGNASATVQVGPYAPVAGRPIVLTLGGSWTGAAQLLRSVDGGATRHPLTVGGSVWARFTANACEQVWEENEVDARFYLSLTPATGTIQYRIAQ